MTGSPFGSEANAESETAAPKRCVSASYAAVCEDRLPGETISTVGGRLPGGGGTDVEVVVGVGTVVDVDSIAVVTVVGVLVVVVVGIVIDVVGAAVVGGGVGSVVAVDELTEVDVIGIVSLVVVSLALDEQEETTTRAVKASVR